jgi:predicted component of type VI protein secretion system
MNKRYLLIIVALTLTVLVIQLDLLKRQATKSQTTIESRSLSLNTDDIEADDRSLLEVTTEIETKGGFELIYDQNPDLNAQIILSKYHMCYLLLKYEIGTDDFNKHHFYYNKSPVQLQFIENSYHHCLELNLQQPKLRLKEGEKINLNDFGRSSFVSAMIDQEVNLAENEALAKSFFERLTESSPQVFLTSGVNYLLEGYHMEQSWSHLMAILKTQDIEYVAALTSVAQDHYNCQVSGDCGLNSFFMFNACLTHEEACLMSDYIEYHEHYLSPGERKDLQLALGYIESLFIRP